ncbi:MAG: asparaginase [Pirellulales bacterium]
MDISPRLLVVRRGQEEESFHCGRAVVATATGETVLAIGDAEARAFPRSAIKPMQAIPLVASGAAEKFSLTDVEIALACGSHAGSPLHVATAQSILEKIGSSREALECGVHWPLDSGESRALAARGEEPTVLHNNCSGKHCGFLAVGAVRGLDVAGYINASHPVMREVTSAISLVTGVQLDESQARVDGCAIPAFSLPLVSVATGFARLGTGEGLSPSLASSVARIRTAIVQNPLMLSGAGRIDTCITAECRGEVFVKSGAEGVMAASIPALGYGLAVKIDDGAQRAATAVMANLLLQVLQKHGIATANAIEALTGHARFPLKNWNGTTVGSVEPVFFSEP